MSDEARKQRGVHASSDEFARYDQVHKARYHLAEAADQDEAFDESFRFTTCDLGRFLRGDDAQQQAFVDELGAALREIGFAILDGHGVDAALFDEATRLVEEFFTRTPAELKQAFVAERHGAVKEGYFPIRETSDIHPDLVEGWVFGRRAFDLDDDATYDASALWPDPRFEPRFRPLVEALLPLFGPIMSAILRSLGCAADLYDDRLAKPRFGLRLNYYPPIDEAMDDGASRLLGHEDIDLFTLLPAPREEGLQVLKRDGRWVRLTPPRGTIVLNVGDYLSRISNEILPSTTHRVGRPRAEAARRRARTSFPLAAYLPPDDVLRVLPGLPEPKFEPIKVITFHTRTTAKFYGDDYAVEEPVDE